MLRVADRDGWVELNSDTAAAGHERIFAVGDASVIADKLAASAGPAEDPDRQARGQQIALSRPDTETFSYFDKGTKCHHRSRGRGAGDAVRAEARCARLAGWTRCTSCSARRLEPGSIDQLGSRCEWSRRSQRSPAMRMEP